VNFPLEENDPILQEQIADRHLSLALVALHPVGAFERRQMFKRFQGGTLSGGVREDQFRPLSWQAGRF
jgi:hypothetical protein